MNCTVPCLGHTEVSKMQSPRDTSSSLPHTLLPAGRKKTIHPVPALPLPVAALLRLRLAPARKSPSLSRFPPAELKAKEHSGCGGALRMYLWEKAGGSGVMRRCINLPWEANMSSHGSGYPRFIVSQSCIPHIPTIPRETLAKTIGVSKNGTVRNTQKIEILLLK